MDFLSGLLRHVPMTVCLVILVSAVVQDMALATLPLSLEPGPSPCSLDNGDFNRNVDSGQCSTPDILNAIVTLPAPKRRPKSSNEIAPKILPTPPAKIPVSPDSVKNLPDLPKSEVITKQQLPTVAPESDGNSTVQQLNVPPSPQSTQPEEVTHSNGDASDVSRRVQVLIIGVLILVVFALILLLLFLL